MLFTLESGDRCQAGNAAGATDSLKSLLPARTSGERRANVRAQAHGQTMEDRQNMSEPETKTDAGTDGAPVSPGALGLSLLPCPFCGSSATLHGRDDDGEIVCDNHECQCRTGTGEVEVCIRAWNRRPLPIPTVKECPSCDGNGEYSFPEGASIDGSDGWYSCERCNGTGTIVAR